MGCTCEVVDGWADDNAECGVRCSADGINAGGSSVLNGRMSYLSVGFRTAGRPVVTAGACISSGGGVGSSEIVPERSDWAATSRQAGTAEAVSVSPFPAASTLPRTSPPAAVTSCVAVSSSAASTAPAFTGCSATGGTPAFASTVTGGVRFVARGLLNASGIAGTILAVVRFRPFTWTPWMFVPLGADMAWVATASGGLGRLG